MLSLDQPTASDDNFRYSKENFPKILAIVDRINKVAQNHSITSTQATLAWILAQGSEFIPIPGTRKTKYLEENIKAASVTLTPEEIKELRAIAVEGDAIGGDRYGLGLMDFLFLDSPELPK
jgi:aryl-alcohol dehydrogenase-like predicted oxidoreductase